MNKQRALAIAAAVTVGTALAMWHAQPRQNGTADDVLVLYGNIDVREANLGRDDVADLLDLLLGDRAVLEQALVDARIGALLHDLAQLPLLGLGDEHACRVGADVDRGAEHVPEADLLRGPGAGSACAAVGGALAESYGCHFASIFVQAAAEAVNEM